MNYIIKNIISLLLISTLLISCTQNQSNGEATKEATKSETTSNANPTETTDSIAATIALLDQNIMVTHDEVMPKIGLVLSLRRNINAKIDSCQTETCKEALQEISYQLTKADADMMQWMRTYQTPQGKDTAIQYLKNQQQEIDRVKSQILQSIEAAKKAK